MHQFAYTRVESNRGNLYAIQIAKVSDYGRSQIMARAQIVSHRRNVWTRIGRKRSTSGFHTVA